MTPEDDARVRIVTIIVLGAALVCSIAGLTVVAVLTDRDLLKPELMALVLALAVATIGGLPQHWWRRRSHWRIERDEGN
jgi:membrane protein YdbS with pleckstrin-like domain